MRTQRLIVLASVALAAIACAVPATASASGTWTDKGKKLTKDATTNLTGLVGFETALGGFACVTHTEVTLTAKYDGVEVKTGTGHVVKNETTTDECVGTGFLEECELVDHEETEAAKMLTATKTKIDIVDAADTHYAFSGCGLSEAEITIEEITLTPDNSLAIGSVTLSGEGIAHIFGLEVPTEATGELEVVGEDAGTYGVHEPAP